MSSTLFYIIQLNIILVLLFAVYSIIKNKLPFWSRRLILTSLPIVSGLTIYIQQILSSTSVPNVIPTINLQVVTIIETNQTEFASAFNYQLLLVFGSLLFISFTIYKITKVLAQFKQAKKDKIEDTVVSKFIISKDGSIQNLSIKKSVRTDIDNEAIRVIQSMPNWIPGEKDGQKVDVQFFLPITFKLTD